MRKARKKKRAAPGAWEWFFSFHQTLMKREDLPQADPYDSLAFFRGDKRVQLGDGTARGITFWNRFPGITPLNSIFEAVHFGKTTCLPDCAG